MAALAVYPSRDFPDAAPSGDMLFEEAPQIGRLDMVAEVVAARRLFTRAEYHRMVEVGILTDGERVELIVLSDDTEPEPDVQILRRRSVPYKEREGDASDALLVIEVAESSLTTIARRS
jgi:hypothetical protein